MMDKQTLPEGWVGTTIEETVKDIIGGGTPSKRILENFQGDIPFMTVKDMTVSRPKDTIDHITENALKESSAKLIPEDTIIIATRMGLGKVIRAPFKTAINQDLKALFPHEGIEKNYLELWLKSKANYLESQGTGTTVKGLRLEFIRSLSFPLPPLNEQRRIVSKIEELFSDLDGGEAALKKAQKLIATYRQSVLKAAITGELTKDWREANRDHLESGGALLDRILKTRREQWQGRGKYKDPQAPDTANLPQLPEGWVWATIDTLADTKPYSIADGPFGSKLKTAHYTEKGVRVIRLENIGDGEFINRETFISEEHAKELGRHSIISGDIAIASLGIPLPKACQIPNYIDRAIVKADCIKYRPNSEFVESKFMLSWLISPLLRSMVDKMVRGVGRPRMNLGDIRTFPVPLPSLREQKEVVSQLENITSQISALEAWCETELTRSATLRQSILKDAFSGKLVPQDPTDEPASALLERIKSERAAQVKAKPSPKRGRRKPAKQLDLL